LAQFLLLPHDAPIKGKLRRKLNEEADSAKRDRASKPKDKSLNALTSSAPKTKVPLTEREVTWFADLDNEHVLWFDLATIKYVRHLEKAAMLAKQNPGQTSLLATPSGTEVILCVLRPNAVEITDRFHDPTAARVVAREGGPGSLIDLPRKPITQEMAVARHAALLPHATLSSSQIFRRYMEGDANAGAVRSSPPAALAAAMLLLLVLCGLCVGNIPTMQDADVLYDPLAPPSALHKYRHALSGNHLLNEGAGLLSLSSGPLAVIVPDMIDALRQMSLYTTENNQAYAVVSQQQKQKANEQHRKGAGSHQKPQRNRARTE
jgi:hypothetical protein